MITPSYNAQSMATKSPANHVATKAAIDKTLYTHKLKSSGQRAAMVPWFPTLDDKLIAKEKTHPMVMLESGQITRVARNNLMKINNEDA